MGVWTTHIQQIWFFTSSYKPLKTVGTLKVVKLLGPAQTRGQEVRDNHYVHHRTHFDQNVLI